MAEPKVELRGADELDRTLERAAKEIGDLEDADKAAAALIAREAARRAPRRTGKLAGSLKAGTVRGKPTVSSDLVYAPPIHYGWRARNIAPNRFLTEAADATERQWLAFYETDTQKALDKVKGA